MVQVLQLYQLMHQLMHMKLTKNLSFMTTCNKSPQQFPKNRIFTLAPILMQELDAPKEAMMNGAKY